MDSQDEMNLNLGELDITSEDFWLDEVDVHIQQNLEDEIVKGALDTGVDLRQYSKTVERELLDVENASIQDYIKESQNIASLHKQISACDTILERMEQMLNGFQGDLSSISTEILTLQEQSVTMNVKLKNRQSVRGELSQFVDEMVIPETMINHILDTPVTEREFLEQLHELHHKINFVKEQSFKEARSCIDVKDILEKLKIKAISKIREYILQKINSFKKPMSNYQVPQNAMLKFRFFNEFLMSHERHVAREIRDEYVDTMSKIYMSYFKGYLSRLMKLQFEESADKDDLMGAEDSAKKGFFSSKPTLKNRSTVFTLGSRGEVLTTDLEGPIIVPHASQKQETKHNFESLFRSLHFAIMDNCCREYLFLVDFFMVSGSSASDLFNAIMSKTLSLFMTKMEEHTAECYDSIAIFLCIHIVYRYKSIMNKRAVPAIDRYWDSLVQMMWPRFQHILELNTQSVRAVDPSKLGHIDVRPHYITRRYAEFSAAIVGINQSFPDDRVYQLLSQLQSEVENFILKIAAEFPHRKEQLICLINNYDMLLAVLMKTEIQIMPKRNLRKRDMCRAGSQNEKEKDTEIHIMPKRKRMCSAGMQNEMEKFIKGKKGSDHGNETEKNRQIFHEEKLERKKSDLVNKYKEDVDRCKSRPPTSDSLSTPTPLNDESVLPLLVLCGLTGDSLTIPAPSNDESDIPPLHLTGLTSESTDEFDKLPLPITGLSCDSLITTTLFTDELDKPPMTPIGLTGDSLTTTMPSTDELDKPPMTPIGLTGDSLTTTMPSTDELDKPPMTPIGLTGDSLITTTLFTDELDKPPMTPIGLTGDSLTTTMPSTDELDKPPMTPIGLTGDSLITTTLFTDELDKPPMTPIGLTGDSLTTTMPSTDELDKPPMTPIGLTGDSLITTTLFTDELDKPPMTPIGLTGDSLTTTMPSTDELDKPPMTPIGLTGDSLTTTMPSTDELDKPPMTPIGLTGDSLTTTMPSTDELDKPPMTPIGLTGDSLITTTLFTDELDKPPMTPIGLTGDSLTTTMPSTDELDKPPMTPIGLTGDPLTTTKPSFDELDKPPPPLRGLTRESLTTTPSANNSDIQLPTKKSFLESLSPAYMKVGLQASVVAEELSLIEDQEMFEDECFELNDDELNDPDWKFVDEDEDSGSDSNEEVVNDSEDDISEVFGPTVKLSKTSSSVADPLEKLFSAVEIPMKKKAMSLSDVELSQNKSSETVPAKRNLSCEECSFDTKNNKIYIKSYKHNSNQENSKHGRMYDTVHACFYCCRLFTNITIHLEKKHKNEDVMKQILYLKAQRDQSAENEKSDLTKDIRTLQNLIRHRGNHAHNEKVVKSGEGEILLSRRKQCKVFNLKDYGPCTDCLEWILLDLIIKHKSSCPAKGNATCQSKGAAIMHSKMMKGTVVMGGSLKLRKEVFPSMVRDSISEVAQSDNLICGLGDIWLMKNIGNKIRYKNYTSFRMRLSARMLIMLREDSNNETASMSDFLNVDNFDRLVRCSIKMCEEDEHENLKKPSTALKLGYDLQRLASLKEGLGMKTKNNELKNEAVEFLRLIKIEWIYLVTKLARFTLEARNFNKHKALPNPLDIAKLATFLVTKLKDLNLGECSEAVFREVVILTEARLLLYNRRRPGELESLRIDTYHNRSTQLDEADMALRGDLTEYEKHLLETQDLVEIRGKRGRGVPILIPQEVRRTLEYLVNPEHRRKAGIKEDNPYVFANKGNNVIRAGDSLDEVKNRPEAQIKNPERIYANNLRKQTATIAQAVSLNDTQLKWLCNHLGHTGKIHEQYYRQTSGLIERIEIAKLMLIQEHNLVGKFRNKELSEIEFEDIEDAAEIKDSREKSQDKDDVDILMEDDEETIESPKKKPAASVRVKWTKEEEAEIRQYFNRYFSKEIKKTCPSREDCMNALKKSKDNNGYICTRNWETLKKKERTTEDSRETESFKELLTARTGEFIEEILSPYFGGMIMFVKDCEVQMDRGGPDSVKCDERRVQQIVRGFNNDWKRALEMINGEVMRAFTNFKNGTQILQGALTQLIQYYHRFQKVLSQGTFRNMQIRNELINIHHVMVEVKKYKPTF